MKLALLTALTLSLSATAFAADPGVTDKEIVIGGHVSASGKMAIYAPTSRGAEAYFNQLNEKGGVNGRKIKYIKVDTAGEHVKTVQASKKLVEEDNIFAFFLGQGATHKAVYKYLIEKNVPDFYFNDALLEYSQPPQKLLFPIYPPFNAEGRALAEVAASAHKGKKVCFLVTDDAMGEEFYKGGREAVEAANAKLKDGEKLVVGPAEKADRLAPQVNTQVLKLKKEGCQVVLNSTYGPLCPNSMVYAHGQDFKPVWMLMSWNVGPKFLELLPEGAREGVVSTATLASSDEFGVKGWGDFAKLMEKDGIPLQKSQTGYVAAELFTEAVRRAGKDVSRVSVMKAAESLGDYTCSLCLSPLGVSADNHAPFSKPTVVVSKAGKWAKL